MRLFTRQRSSKTEGGNRSLFGPGVKWKVIRGTSENMLTDFSMSLSISIGSQCLQLTNTLGATYIDLASDSWICQRIDLASDEWICRLHPEHIFLQGIVSTPSKHYSPVSCLSFCSPISHTIPNLVCLLSTLTELTTTQMPFMSAHVPQRLLFIRAPKPPGSGVSIYELATHEHSCTLPQGFHEHSWGHPGLYMSTHQPDIRQAAKECSRTRS
jgi:hypothetical protein